MPTYEQIVSKVKNLNRASKFLASKDLQHTV